MVVNTAHFSSSSLEKVSGRTGENSEVITTLPPPLPSEVKSVVFVTDQLVDSFSQTKCTIPQTSPKSDTKSVLTLAASAMTTTTVELNIDDI